MTQELNLSASLRCWEQNRPHAENNPRLWQQQHQQRSGRCDVEGACSEYLSPLFGYSHSALWKAAAKREVWLSINACTILLLGNIWCWGTRAKAILHCSIFQDLFQRMQGSLKAITILLEGTLAASNSITWLGSRETFAGAVGCVCEASLSWQKVVRRRRGCAALSYRWCFPHIHLFQNSFYLACRSLGRSRTAITNLVFWDFFFVVLNKWNVCL